MGNINSFINQDNIHQVQKAANQDSIETVLLKSDMQIDFHKPVYGCLLQLQNWSLQEIRIFYSYFRQRQKYPFIDKSLFKILVSTKFSEKTANYIYDVFSKKQKYINIYELVAVLVILSHSNMLQKVHCKQHNLQNIVIFLVFDFDKSESISMEEILLIFVCIVNGFARITNQQPPNYYNIEYFAKIMFLKSDIHTDNQLQICEIMNWLNNNSIIYSFFMNYEPNGKIVQNLQVLRCFSPYTEEEAEYIGKLIKSQQQDNHRFQKFIDQVNQQINHQNQSKLLLPKLTQNFNLDRKSVKIQMAMAVDTKSHRVSHHHQHQSINNSDHVDHNNHDFNKNKHKNNKFYFNKRLQVNFEKYKNKVGNSASSLPKVFSIKQLKLEIFEKARKVMDISKSSKYLNQTEPNDQQKKQDMLNLDFIDKTLQKHYINHSKSDVRLTLNRQISQKVIELFQTQKKNDMSLSKSNIAESIITRGCLLNQSSIFRLKEWFDRMSGYEEYLDLQKYVEIQKDKPFMKNISQNLFKYLDQKQEGKIDFNTLMRKLYPDLTKDQQQLVTRWANQYDRIKNRESQKGYIQSEKDKKHKQTVIVPDTAYNRIKQLFDSCDRQRKLYLTIDDLSNHLNFGFSSRQIEELFKKYNHNRDGKMIFIEFAEMILPSNYNLINIRKQYEVENKLEVREILKQDNQ